MKLLRSGLLAAAFPVAAALVAWWSPSDMQGWFERIWTLSLLAAAITGFVGAEREWSPEAVPAPAFYPTKAPERVRLRRALVSTFTGAVVGGVSALVAAAVAGYVLPEQVFLAAYGTIAGTAVVVHSWTCISVSGHVALRFWPTGDQGRRIALALLQQPVTSIIALAITGVLLLLAQLALQEPARLMDRYTLSGPLPRSMWVGVGVVVAAVIAFGVWSTQKWTQQGGRMIVAARTARAQLRFGERTLAFEPTSFERATPQAAAAHVRQIALQRGLPPVLGISAMLTVAAAGMALFSTNRVFDAVVMWATPVWAFTIAGIPQRAVRLSASVNTAMHSLAGYGPGRSVRPTTAGWLVRQLGPALLVSPFFAGVPAGAWQVGCTAIALVGLAFSTDRAGALLRWLTPVAAGISVVITYL